MKAIPSGWSSGQDGTTAEILYFDVRTALTDGIKTLHDLFSAGAM